MAAHLLFKQELLLFDAFEEIVNGRKICTGLELVVEEVFHSSTSLRFDTVHIHCAYKSRLDSASFQTHFLHGVTSRNALGMTFAAIEAPLALKKIVSAG